jgi:hypothetical protein
MLKTERSWIMWKLEQVRSMPPEGPEQTYIHGVLNQGRAELEAALSLESHAQEARS